MGSFVTPFDHSDAPPLSLRALWRGALRAVGIPVGDLPAAHEIARPACRAHFERAAGMDVETFMGIVTQDLPPLTRQRMFQRDLDNPDLFTVAIEGDGFEDVYTLNFAKGSIRPGSMRSDLRDRVTGRRMFGLRAVGGLVVSIKDMDINAGFATGAYVWARAGVTIKEGQDFLLRKRIQGRLDAVRHRLDDDTIATVQRLIAFQQDDDLATLAGLSQPLPNIKEDWTLCQIVESHSYSAAHMKENGFIQNDTMTLGQFLLFAQKYPATIRLDNPAQMDKLESFTRIPVRALANAHTALRPVAPHA